MAKKAKNPIEKRNETDGAPFMLVVRAPNGQLYTVEGKEIKSADMGKEYPLDVEALQKGDFECWPCKRKK